MFLNTCRFLFFKEWCRSRDFKYSCIEVSCIVKVTGFYKILLKINVKKVNINIKNCLMSALSYKSVTNTSELVMSSAEHNRFCKNTVVIITCLSSV